MRVSARGQTVAEEVANSLSHGLALVLALAAIAGLLLPTARRAPVLTSLGMAVFAATMVVLYASSTLYHAVPPGRLKSRLLKLDYCAIYLFIAGTYTPFTIGGRAGADGWAVCAVIWGLAALGVVLKLSDRLNHPVLSTGLYLLMGWLVLLTGGSLIAQLPPDSVRWLIAGGLAYTVGVAFYALDARLRFGHLVWHLFVMLGTACHVYAVLGQAG